MRLTFLRVAGSLLLICSVFLFFFSLYWLYNLLTPMTLAETQTYEISRGETLSQVAFNLYHKGYLSHPRLFILLAKLKGSEKDIQAGQYTVTPTSTPLSFLNKIVLGKVILHSLTIVEGTTFSTLLETIAKNPNIKHTLENLSTQEVEQKLGFLHENPEGFFYPDTYLFASGVTDVDLLTKAHLIMKKLLMEQWDARQANLPYTRPYDALIAASLIQKESSVAQEKPLIASVIINRLRKNMPLQIDPTVIYGLGSTYDGNITKHDLMTKTPYNTYQIKGLPPTPIAIPNYDSIHAALNPEETTYLYFVAKGDGSHVFSSTLAEHNRAVAKYIINREARLLHDTIIFYYCSNIQNCLKKEYEPMINDVDCFLHKTPFIAACKRHV